MLLKLFEPRFCQVNVPLFRLLSGFAKGMQYSDCIATVCHIEHAKSP